MPVSRRDLLATFLGSPFALSSCFRNESVAELPPGEVVGASADLGHMLRAAVSLSVEESAWKRHRVVIVGGGIAGLSAARRLMRHGIEDFVLLELEPEAGGTSRSGRSDVVSYPWGAHYVPAPTQANPDLVELLTELEVFDGLDERGDPVVAEQYRCRFPQERIFYRGRWYEGLYLAMGASADDLQQLRRFQAEIDRWVAWRDAAGRRAFTLPMAFGSDDPEVTALDQISMADWMDQHRFTSSRLRWYIDFACRDDYGLRAEQTSAWAGLFYFASRQPRPAEDSRPFITWPEGNGRIVQHLSRLAKPRVHTGLAVADIRRQTIDGESVVEVKAIEAAGSRVHGFRAERVIFAAPHFLAKYVIDPIRRRPSSTEFEYGAWAVANLTLSEPPRSEESALAWDNVLYESPSLGYVSATHQRGMDYGRSVLTWYYPMCDGTPTAMRERLLATDRDDWASIALADLERAHPEIRQTCERLDVMRWGHAMILPRPGFIWGGARRAAAEPVEGVHFAHSDLSGLALFEEAFYHGNRAADEVAGELAS